MNLVIIVVGKGQAYGRFAGEAHEIVQVPQHDEDFVHADMWACDPVPASRKDALDQFPAIVLVPGFQSIEPSTRLQFLEAATHAGFQGEDWPGLGEDQDRFLASGRVPNERGHCGHRLVAVRQHLRPDDGVDRRGLARFHRADDGDDRLQVFYLGNLTVQHLQHVGQSLLVQQQFFSRGGFKHQAGSIPYQPQHSLLPSKKGEGRSFYCEHVVAVHGYSLNQQEE